MKYNIGGYDLINNSFSCQLFPEKKKTLTDTFKNKPRTYTHWM